jgi:hypothetical protein
MEKGKKEYREEKESRKRPHYTLSNFYIYQH